MSAFSTYRAWRLHVHASLAVEMKELQKTFKASVTDIVTERDRCPYYDIYLQYERALQRECMPVAGASRFQRNEELTLGP
jgi:hypothetical protein